MNRRGFIGNLAAILAAATGPSIACLEAFDRFKWKAPSEERLIAVINPEWVNAPYEMVFYVHSQVIAHRELPLRFSTADDATKALNPIPPFILQTSYNL